MRAAPGSRVLPMKIAILSRESDSYSTSRLRDAAVARGHEVVVFDTLRFSIVVATTGSTLLYDARPVEDLDAVIPRIGASVTYVGTAVVRQLAPMGVVSLNGAEAISASRDKLRALQLLARHGLPVPPTVFVRDRKGVGPALERLGGAPVVVKLLEGTQGVGVMLAETVEMAQAIVETLQFAKQNVMVQRFVRESRGRDVRVIVVGGKVVAAMRRMSRGREFRSNLHRGGTAEPVALPPAYADVAVRAASVLGLSVAGVDMLEGEAGPVVLEVNSSPGLEGIETTTGIDVAGSMVVALEEAVRTPLVDARDHLAIEPGHGLVAIPVPSGSPLAGRTIALGPLADRDVRVLRLERGGRTIPNPRLDLVLETGDVLIAHGRLDSLRPFVGPGGRGRPTGP